MCSYKLIGLESIRRGPDLGGLVGGWVRNKDLSWGSEIVAEICDV